jgi:hypothetical protein
MALAQAIATLGETTFRIQELAETPGIHLFVVFSCASVRARAMLSGLSPMLG